MDKRENKQIIHELAEWAHRLIILRQENVHLKNQLALTVPLIADNAALEKVEDLQNRILNKDIVIDFIRQDIETLRGYSNGEAIEKELLASKQRKLAFDIKKLEHECYQLQKEFNKYFGKS